jgi:hypothetical protein
MIRETPLRAAPRNQSISELKRGTATPSAAIPDSTASSGLAPARAVRMPVPAPHRTPSRRMRADLVVSSARFTADLLASGAIRSQASPVPHSTSGDLRVIVAVPDREQPVFPQVGNTRSVVSRCPRPGTRLSRHVAPTRRAAASSHLPRASRAGAAGPSANSCGYINGEPSNAENTRPGTVSHLQRSVVHTASSTVDVSRAR